MNKTEIMNKATRALGKVGLQLKKHSPEILIVTGIATGIAGTVMACKATLKVNEVVDEAKVNIDKIHTATERGYTNAGEEYTEEDSKKELAVVYAQTGVKLVKLYAPAVILGTLSITSVLAGHNILRKRNVALAAAYTAVDTSFKQYRSRVVERFGKELDRELKYNIKAKEIEETVVNEDGTETTVKKTVEVIDPEAMYFSEYARCFDETSSEWEKDAEYNKKFLSDTQRYANDLLKRKGHLFLNEVYDMLGMERTRAGQVVGWVYDKDNPVGDNYIDFGIMDIHKEANRNFVNGLERSVWLDFNVDGPIDYLLK